MASTVDAPDLPAALGAARPFVWCNPAWRPAAPVLGQLAFTRADVQAAQRLWQRAAPLLQRLFPELAASSGRVDSPLLALRPETGAQLGLSPDARALVKADHALPVTGCIKARGGVYEVLWFAFDLARRLGHDGRDCAELADPAWRARFAGHKVLVGSTGNLGFSVGVAARALGFDAEVHMSADAKAWKKDRLRALGVRVVEHDGDYTTAVAAARAVAAATPGSHFVDDEASRHLFLGYATAAGDLAAQLAALGIGVDADRPLNVYLPCGVGGAPGGVTLGLKNLWGDAVHCVFVEPVQSPGMLVRLAAGPGRGLSVYDVGLDNRTVADGLACAAASELAASAVESLVEAIVTVADEEMLAWMRIAWEQEGLRLEPSAAAAFAGCARLLAASPDPYPPAAVHVLWTTGGALLPEDVFRDQLNRSPAG
ncbi:MAG: D-serine ammonia-lyase [Betaproteobacteria bacterium]